MNAAFLSLLITPQVPQVTLLGLSAGTSAVYLLGDGLSRYLRGRGLHEAGLDAQSFAGFLVEPNVQLTREGGMFAFVYHCQLM